MTFSLSSVICHGDKVTKLLVGFLLDGLGASDISKLCNLLAYKISRTYISAQLVNGRGSVHVVRQTLCLLKPC